MSKFLALVLGLFVAGLSFAAEAPHKDKKEKHPTSQLEHKKHKKHKKAASKKPKA